LIVSLLPYKKAHCKINIARRDEAIARAEALAKEEAKLMREDK
jgi:hypothetical protein